MKMNVPAVTRMRHPSRLANAAWHHVRRRVVTTDRTIARSLVLTFHLVLMVGSILAAMHAPTDMNEEFMRGCFYASLAVIIGQVCYKLFSTRRTNWVSVELVTMSAYFSVHFAFLIYWLSGENPFEKIVVWESVRGGDASHRVCFVIAMCVAGLAAYAVGFNLLSDRFSMVQPISAEARPELRRWRTLGIRMAILGAGLAVLVLVMLGPGALKGGYSGTKSESMGINLMLRGSSVLISAGLGVTCVSSYELRPKLLAIGLIPMLIFLAYMMGFAIHGDRYVLFSFALIGACAYGERVRPFSPVIVLLCGVAGIAAFTFIGVARVSPERTLPSMYRTYMRHHEKVRSDTAVVATAVQIQSLFAAAAWVPEKHDYYHGKMAGLDTLGLVPFAARLPLVQRAFHGTEQYEKNSSHLLTWLVVGNFDSGGKATTSVANMYLDWGLTGVVVGMLLQGLFCKYLQQRSRETGGVMVGCAYCLILPIMGYSQRASFISQLGANLIWPILVMFCLASVSGVMGSRSRKLPAGGMP